jgi:hypothetical protein
MAPIIKAILNEKMTSAPYMGGPSHVPGKARRWGKVDEIYLILND